MEGTNGSRVTGVNELVLEVVDLDRAVTFYTRVLGLPLVDRDDESGRAWLMAGERTRIGLWRSQVGIANGRGGVHVHYAMHIEQDDLADALELMQQNGHTPELVEWDDGRGTSAYVEDPDGHVVELWTWDVADHLPSARRAGG